MKIIKEFKHTFPICYVDGNKILAYHRGELRLIDLITSQIISQIPLIGSPSKLLLKFPFYERFFRDYPRCGLSFSNRIVIYYKSRLIEYSNISRQFTGSFPLPNGIRPLQFTEIKNIDGFEDGIYFGEYLGNFTRNPVGIYKRNSANDWVRLPIFKKNQINHIHALIPDKDAQCVWIFTGDFEQSSGIWKAESNFSKITPIIIGSQEYRGCVGYPIKGGLLYATDSQFIHNSIRLLQKNGDKYESRLIYPINGSCIYGCVFKNKFIFESSVEGSGLYKNRLQFLLSRKKGQGIIENKTCLYIGTMTDKFKEIFSLKKDIMPFSFQFATMQFPSGINDTNRLVFAPIATTKYSMSTLIVEL